MPLVYGQSAYVNRDRSKVWRENVVAIDGEGWGVDELGRQYYRLLVAADTLGLSWYVYNETGVTPDQAFNFLLELPYAHYTSFSFTYDVTQILRMIPDEHVQSELCLRDRTGYVAWGKWLIDWRKGKYFRIKQAGSKYAFTIWDAYAFYQKSLIAAIESSLLDDPKLMEIIEAGKRRRGTDMHDVSEEVKYATAECVMLARMQQQLFRDIETLGINLNAFYGPGSVAEAKMRQEGVPAFLAPIAEQWREAAEIAYAGGRFETLGHGYQSRLWGYDINSAYPAALIHCPCLAHCEWRQTREVWDLSLVHVKWKLREGNWGPFPVHTHHGLHFPFEGESWVWGWEFNAAQLLRCNFVVLECVTPIAGCDHKPFRFVGRAYATRQKMKAAGNGLEKVYKLWLNSLYGKTAQSIGHPAFASPVWAGMITSWTRAQLLRVIATGKVVSTATDGLTACAPIDLPLSKELGEWDKPEVYNDVLMMQPGVWYAAEDTRTRGCNPTAMNWQLARDTFAGLSEKQATAHEIANTHVPVPDHSVFVTLTQANAEGKLEGAGVWRTGNHRFRFYSSKRPVVRWTGNAWFDSYPAGYGA